jgi:hypothetical protein
MSSLFTTAAALAGAALIALSLWLRARSSQCRRWPSVEGTVLESRVDDAHLEFMKPVLRYRYAVDGRSYVGFRVAFSGYGVSRRAMAALIRPYALGEQVRVYYNPRDPASAVLDNRGQSDWGYWLLFGLGFCVMAFYLSTLRS